MNEVKEFISHYSAAYHWKVPHLDEVLGELDAKKRRTEDPIHVTITDPSRRYKKIGRINHLCTTALPSGAVKNNKGKYVASPELVFLQLANHLDMDRLIFLGLQMCSHPPGKKSEAITTKRKIEVFLEKMSGHRGHRKATRALKYIENGSNSIMESIVYMILTLPHTYGGYSLKGAVLNHEIISDTDTLRRPGKKRYYVDFFYRKEKVAVEYDSRTYHSSMSEQGRDSVRATSIVLQGVDVLSFTTTQLSNIETCDEFAHMLADRLGRGLRIRYKGFKKSQRELRKILPMKK